MTKIAKHGGKKETSFWWCFTLKFSLQLIFLYHLNIYSKERLHTPLIPALRRQRWAGHYEFEVSLVYQWVPRQLDLHNETVSWKKINKMGYFSSLSDHRTFSGHVLLYYLYDFIINLERRQMPTKCKRSKTVSKHDGIRIINTKTRQWG